MEENEETKMDTLPTYSATADAVRSQTQPSDKPINLEEAAELIGINRRLEGAD